MEMTSHQNLNILRQFTNSQSLKKVTQLFLSVSVFSLFFSHTSLLPFLHSLNFCFSTFPYQLFTHTLDKNFMFLICNGLLVFLAKYSGLVRSLSLTSHQDESRSKNVIESSHSDLSMEKEVENVAVKEGNEEEFSFTNQREIETEVEIEEAITESKEQEQGSRIMASKEEEEEEEKEESSLVHVADLSNDSFLAEQGTKEEDEEDNKDVLEEYEEEEEEEEVENGMLSTEELDKKFDEFIRRMKEELRIEAQRQLIMAV